MPFCCIEMHRLQNQTSVFSSLTSFIIKSYARERERAGCMLESAGSKCVPATVERIPLNPLRPSLRKDEFVNTLAAALPCLMKGGISPSSLPPSRKPRERERGGPSHVSKGLNTWGRGGTAVGGFQSVRWCARGLRLVTQPASKVNRIKEFLLDGRNPEGQEM